MQNETVEAKPAGSALEDSLRRHSPLNEKTLDFALAIIALHGQLPRGAVSDVVGRQLLRCATSIGAQYREACRARSKAEFVSKMESSLQEAEETLYWLELLKRSKTLTQKVTQPYEQAAVEIVRMMVASINTVKAGSTAKVRSAST